MRPSMRHRYTIALGSALTALGVAGCGSSSPTDTGGSAAITFTVSPTSATVQQGASTQVIGTIVRSGGFTGEVAVSMVNPPAGITAALAGPIAVGSNTGVATLSVASTTIVGVDTITIQATGSGVTTVTAQFILTVTAAPLVGNFSLIAAPLTVNVAQGGSGTTGVKAIRTNGLTGAISLAASGAPTGLTIAFATTSTVDSSLITATATSALAAGPYSIVITGASGLLTHTANITVTVVAAARIDFSVCAAAARPIWLATQDGAGAWTRVTGTGDSYSFPSFTSGKGGVAFVTQRPAGSGQIYTTYVKYVAATDISSIVPCAATTVAGKTINGSVSGTGTKAAQIALGPVPSVFATAASSTFQVLNVPTGPYDLLSFLAAFTGPSTNDPIIIRRDLDIADGGTIPVLNYAGPEIVTSASAVATITGGGTAPYIASLRYLTRATCVSDSFTFNNTSFPSPLTIYGVPAASQRATDFHNLIIEQNNSDADYRTVTTSFHAMSNQTVAIGSGIGAVTYTTLSGPYLRLQAAITLAPEYKSAGLNFATPGNNAQTFYVDQSAAYIGGNTAVTLAAPDFSTVAGWLPAWGPTTTGQHSSTVSAASTPPATLCAEGATTRTARSSVGLFALRAQQ